MHRASGIEAPTLMTYLVQMQGEFTQIFTCHVILRFLYLISFSSLPLLLCRRRFREFFRNYQKDSIFIYRDALILRWGRREYFVEVDLAHLNEFDEVLYNNLQVKPDEMMPLFEKGARDALNNLLTNQSLEAAANQNITQDFQVILRGAHAPQSLRSLTAEHINKLIKVLHYTSYFNIFVFPIHVLIRLYIRSLESSSHAQSPNQKPLSFR
jgi:hypothetical protein